MAQAAVTLAHVEQQHVEHIPSRNVGRAYQLLHFGFVVLPIIAGADKFFNVLVHWDDYLAPFVTGMLGPVAPYFMYAVGIVEIVAGIVVARAPRFGGYLVAVWLWAIIINLLLIPGYYDIALRDFGLSLGGLALAQLANEE